jgi:hypothetical protein
MLEFPFLYIERHRSEKSKHLLFLKLKKLQRTCGCLKRDLYLNPVTLVATQRLIRKQRILLIDYILSLANVGPSFGFCNKKWELNLEYGEK